MSHSIEEDLPLRSIFDSVIIGILVVKANCIIKAANQACQNIFGHSEEELNGMWLVNFFTAESKVKFNSHFLELVVEGNVSFEEKVINLDIISKQNKIIPIELSITSTVVNSADHYILAVKNVSEKKELQVKLKEQLKNKKEIEVALQKEQELNELKSRFVSMASHEFRTPLTGIQSSIALIQRYINLDEENQITLSHNDKIQNHFEKIRESIRNLTQILNEFLSIDGLEDGKIKCEYNKVNISTLCKNTTQELSRLCKKNQKIKTTEQTLRKEYILEYNMIRNVLNNLISNAIKYSPENSTISLSITEKNENLIFEVKDQGIGIPEEEKANMFGRFFRAKNATNIQGTGLGLNIVKRYVELMDGTVSFTSKLNEGTTFKVIIPVRNEI